MASSTAVTTDHPEEDGPTFPIKMLPPEIRDMIWGFTLPGQRLFHIKLVSHPSNTGTCRFFFHINHRPPVALGVCKESRAVAQNNGFFLSKSLDFGGLWFNPEVDILYLDRNQRRVFHQKPSEKKTHVANWDRVQHFGLEWRAFFRDTPHPTESRKTAEYWKAAIAPLQYYMPNMKTLNYILPKIRHKGGPTWGREGHKVQGYPAELVPLAGTIMIPWVGERSENQLRRQLGRLTDLVSWSEVKKDIELSFDIEDSDASAGGSSVRNKDGKYKPWGEWRPEIVGWWLLRPDAPPPTINDPNVMEFDY